MDLYLKGLLQGKKHSHELQAARKESPLHKMLNEQIDVMVEQLVADDDPATFKLVSPTLRRAQLREELTEELKMPELTSHLNTALKILLTEKHACLAAAAEQQLQDAFSQIAALLDKRDVLDIKRLETSQLKEVLGMTDGCLESMAKVAIYKYMQGLYAECTSIFALLTTLSPENWAYWYRLGIAAQECGLIDLAARAYQAASTVHPAASEPHILAAECFLALHECAQAQIELAEAEKSASAADDECLQLIKSLKEQLL